MGFNPDHSGTTPWSLAHKRHAITMSRKAYLDLLNGNEDDKDATKRFAGCGSHINVIQYYRQNCNILPHLVDVYVG